MAYPQPAQTFVRDREAPAALVWQARRRTCAVGRLLRPLPEIPGAAA